VDTLTRVTRVLIVDDQEPFRSAARLVVSMADGFEVVGEAASGEEGIAMAAELLPALVLMDINMPGIDGLEATRRITKAHPAIRVLVLSTYEADEYEPLALDAGAVGFVSKAELAPTDLANHAAP
jgi:DNA-binding NarL/FixJ family response regulator